MSANNETDYNNWTRTRTPDPNTASWERASKERADQERRQQIIERVPSSSHPVGPNRRTDEAGSPVRPVPKHHLGLPTGTIPTSTDQPDWSLDTPPHPCVHPEDSSSYLEPETLEAAPESPAETPPAVPSEPIPDSLSADVAAGDIGPNPATVGACGTAANLTEKQRKVIELIHAGYSVSGAMEYVRMGRRTFYDWREASPLFKQATEAARENYRGTVSDGVHELQQSVRGLIENCIQSDNVPMGQRLRAASLFLRYVHAENMLPRPLARRTPPASPAPPVVNPSPEGSANSGAPAGHHSPSAANHAQKSWAELFAAMAGPSINALDPYLDVLMAAPPPSAEAAPEAATRPTHTENSDKPVRTVRSNLPSDTQPYPRNATPGASGNTVPDHGDQIAPPTPGTTSPVPADPDILSQIPGLSPGHYLYDPSPAHTENSDQPVRTVRSTLPSQSGHRPLATDHGVEDAPGPSPVVSRGPAPSESETNPFSLNPKPGAEGAFPNPEEET